MSLAELRRLACPSCARPHDLPVLLDRVRSALRSGPWVSLGCPSCGARRTSSSRASTPRSAA